MSNHDAYTTYLKNEWNLSEADVPRILDAEESNLLQQYAFAIALGGAPSTEIQEYLGNALRNFDTSVNTLLGHIQDLLREQFSLKEDVLVRWAPTPEFGGIVAEVDDFALVLVNNGTLQLIGAVVQLLNWRQPTARKIHELRDMVINYRNLDVPSNRAFAGTWADFDAKRCLLGGAFATGAEAYMILHEYGHVALGRSQRPLEDEFEADRWALERITNHSSAELTIGSFIFLGLNYLIERAASYSPTQKPLTHPSAAIRIALAAVSLMRLVGAQERAIIVQFLQLVDAAAAELGDAGEPLLSTLQIFEVASSLQNGLLPSIFQFIGRADTMKGLQALLDVVRDEGRTTSASNGRHLPYKKLPPGLSPSEERGIFLYLLPSGDAMEMVLVPSGDFLAGPCVLPGFPDIEDLERSAETRSATIAREFYIGRYPVTVYQFEAFCRSQNREQPQSPDWKSGPTHPIVNVSIQDAEAFCHWAGLALPSELQWEKSMRGVDGRLYPGGTSSVVDTGVMPSSPSRAQPDPATVSPFGVEHGVGNVWEMTSDWLESDSLAYSGKYRVVRGGSYRCRSEGACVLSRHRVSRNFSFEDIGFRAILEPPNQPEAPSEHWTDFVLGDDQEDLVKSPPPRAPRDDELAAAQRLFDACTLSIADDNVRIVQEVLAEHPECVRWHDADGLTPLLKVATYPYFESAFGIAKILVGAGADLNAQTPDGSSALHILAMRPQYYSLDIAALLLEEGADTTLVDRRGATARMVAQRFQHIAGDAFLALLSNAKRSV